MTCWGSEMVEKFFTFNSLVKGKNATKKKGKKVSHVIWMAITRFIWLGRNNVSFEG